MCPVSGELGDPKVLFRLIPVDREMYIRFYAWLIVRGVKLYRRHDNYAEFSCRSTPYVDTVATTQRTLGTFEFNAHLMNLIKLEVECYLL